MPRPATANQLTFYGAAGNSVRPDIPWDAVEAFHNAISELAAMAWSGGTRHRCGVHFGQDVVRVLAAAEQALAFPALPIPEP